jgi:hypothetical protein
MRLVTWTFIGAACAAAIFASPAARSANVPLCLAIAQNYNNCVRQNQFAYRRGYGHAYPGGPYGDYGDYGGYDGDDGPAYGPGYGGYGPGYGGYRRRGHERAKAACAVWFAQMQASGCFK